MILTICGSATYEEQFKQMNEDLSLNGHVVFSLAVYPSDHENNKDWYNKHEKETLDLVHLAKIKLSEAIVVLNVDGYIGDSTRREIAWANVLGKKVYYLEDVQGRATIDMLPAVI